MRQKRRNLSDNEQKQASLALKKQLLPNPLFIRSKHIAFYIANDGEIDPWPILKAALAMGKHCYLPVLHPTRPGYLWFCRYNQNDKLKNNKFGIPEPIIRNHRQRKRAGLDLVLTPLVAFDKRGTRIGMGGGYYDRTFNNLYRTYRFKPALIGLSHECQQVDKLTADSWDIKLTLIVTDFRIYP